MIRFATEGIIVQDLEEQDFPELLRIYNREANMQFIPSGKKYWSEAAFRKKMQNHMANYCFGYGIFSVKLKENMRLIGEAGLFNSFENPKILELGYIIDHHYWNKGYGTEVCQGLINYGFKSLNLQKVTARMFAENEASIKLSQKCGMQFIRSGSEKGIDYVEYELSVASRSNIWFIAYGLQV